MHTPILYDACWHEKKSLRGSPNNFNNGKIKKIRGKKKQPQSIQQNRIDKNVLWSIHQPRQYISNLYWLHHEKHYLFTQSNVKKYNIHSKSDMKHLFTGRKKLQKSQHKTQQKKKGNTFFCMGSYKTVLK
jgi:hypothetical protein